MNKSNQKTNDSEYYAIQCSQDGENWIWTGIKYYDSVTAVNAFSHATYLGRDSRYHYRLVKVKQTIEVIEDSHLKSMTLPEYKEYLQSIMDPRD